MAIASENIRIKYCCEINPSKSRLSKTPLDSLVSFLPMEKISEDGKLELSETRPLEEVWNGFTYFEDLDTIVAKITPCFENGKGALCTNLKNGIGLGSTEFHVLRPKPSIVPKYLFYITRSDRFIAFGKASMQGVAGQQRVPTTYLNEVKTWLPTIANQHAIAAFLDRKTAQIDALIEKKQRQIKLLQEKRTSLISQAVTKGLNPHVKMKDSGVEWLGEIPAHWEVKRIKYLFSLIGGGTPSTNNSEYWEGDIPWVSSKDMKHFYLNDTEDHITDIGLKESSTRMVSENTVLMVMRSGILRHTLPVAITIKRMAINQDIKGFVKRNNQIEPRYFLWFVGSNQQQLLSAWKKEGTTVESLELEDLINDKLILPPIFEQNKIVQYVEAIENRTSSIIDLIQSSIFKLTEYRTALISAAVTGKIDVREYAE